MTNNQVMAGLCAAILLIGFLAACWKNDFVWFARCGSLVVGLGLVVLCRAVVSGHEVKPTIIGADTGLNMNSRAHFERLGEPVPEYILEQERNLLAIGVLGPLLSIIGTVVWGFGDLLNGPLQR